MTKSKRAISILALLVFGTNLCRAQSRELDVDLLNKNFENMWGFRLNNFPRPDYVKNTRTAFFSNRLGFAIKFISVADYETNHNTAGITNQPFVSRNQIFIVLYVTTANKIIAALDPGQPNHEEMQRVVDLGLLANELLFDITTRAQRRDILLVLEKVSKMSDDKEKDEALLAIVKKHFPVYEIIKFFALLNLRFGNIHPQAALIPTMDFITGRSTADIIKQFITNNLFGY